MKKHGIIYVFTKVSNVSLDNQMYKVIATFQIRTVEHKSISESQLHESLGKAKACFEKKEGRERHNAVINPVKINLLRSVNGPRSSKEKHG